MDSTLLLLLLLLLYHTSATRLLQVHHHLSPQYLSHLHMGNSKAQGNSISVVQLSELVRDLHEPGRIKELAGHVDTLLVEEENNQLIITEKKDALLKMRLAKDADDKSSELLENIKALLNLEDVKQTLDEMEGKLMGMSSSSADVASAKENVRSLLQRMPNLEAKQKLLFEAVEPTMIHNVWIERELNQTKVFLDQADEGLKEVDLLQKSVRESYNSVLKACERGLKLVDIPDVDEVITIHTLAFYMEKTKHSQVTLAHIGQVIKSAEDGLKLLPSFATVIKLREHVGESGQLKERLQKNEKDLATSMKEIMRTDWYREQQMEHNERAIQNVFSVMDEEEGKKMEEVVNGKEKEAKILTSEERRQLQNYVDIMKGRLANSAAGLHSMSDNMGTIQSERKWVDIVNGLKAKLKIYVNRLKKMEEALK